MLVQDRMSTPAVTVEPDLPFQEALKLMQQHRFRRLPVVDRRQRLVGIVSERDLLHAAPSPATSLNIWELNYLLSKLTVGELMTRQVHVVTPDTPIEEAARLMVAHKIGGLPVVDQARHVLGVITETDIFKVFSEMLGSDVPGLRLVLAMPPGQMPLAALLQALVELNGRLVSVGTFRPDEQGHARVLIKVAGIPKEALLARLEALGDHVLDVREV